MKFSSVIKFKEMLTRTYLIRNLAGLHPTTIQILHSGTTTDIKLASFSRIAKAHGFTLELQKGERISAASKRDE
jgi:hypothetical protein